MPLFVSDLLTVDAPDPIKGLAVLVGLLVLILVMLRDQRRGR